MDITFQDAAPLFHVYDVPTSVAFYRDVLGFEVTHASQPFDDVKDNYGWAMLRRDGVMLMVNNMYEDNVRPETPDPARTAAHRDTILYINCHELDALRLLLQQNGITPYGPVTTYYGMVQLTVHDPDGYSLCFQRPADPSSST